MTLKKNRYMGKRKVLGLALSTTRRHPYGKGAAKLNPETLVKRGEKGGMGDATVSRELQARANISKNKNPKVYRKFKRAADIARRKAHHNKEYAVDKVNSK